MGFAAPAVAAAGIFGAAISASGAYDKDMAAANAAAYQAQVARNNAVIARQNAGWTEQAGAAKEAAVGMHTRGAVGEIKVAQAASGVDVNTGSNAAVRAARSELGVMDALTVRSTSAKEAYGYEVAAESSEAQATLDEYQSRNAREAAPMDALGTFLTGASSVGGKFASWSTGAPAGGK